MFRVVLALAVAGVLSFAGPISQAAPPLEAYGRLPALEQVSVSPSGQRYAMITVVGEARKLVVATSDDKPLLVAGLGDAKVRGIRWAGEDHVLVETSATVTLGMDFSVDREELFGVVAINVLTGKLTPIFPRNGAIEPTVIGTYGARLVDGQWFGFFGGITMDLSHGGDYFLSHTYPDLYRVNLDTGVPDKVASGSEVGDGWLVGPNGEVIARASYDQRQGDWKIMRGGFAGPVLASGNNPYGGVTLEGLGRTPGALLVNVPKAHGNSVEEIPLAGGVALEVAESRYITETLHDRRTRTWIGYVQGGDVPELTMFDPQTAARVRGTRKAFPNQSVAFTSWSDDFNRIVVFTSGGDDSGTYWLVDIARGAADPIGHAYPDVPPEAVGPIRMVDWKAADGLQLHGVLSLPPGRPAHNLPVVVLPHGGPEVRDYPVFDWWAQAFASRGYAVLQPNFRGSAGYGAGFVEAGQGQWGRKMQTDVSDGLAELVKEGIVDPKRACIVGGSYGGYAALAGVTVQHGLYRCAVADAGVADLGGMLAYEYAKRRAVSASTRYWKAFMGPESGFGEISPLRLAAKADAPILLIHGKDDTVVLYDQSRAMAKALQAAGKPVELVTMPNEDHWLSREATRIQMLKAAVAFVEKYNPPDPAPAAVAVTAK